MAMSVIFVSVKPSTPVTLNSVKVSERETEEKKTFDHSCQNLDIVTASRHARSTNDGACIHSSDE